MGQYCSCIPIFEKNFPKNAHQSPCNETVLFVIRLIGALFFTGCYVWFYTSDIFTSGHVWHLLFLSNFGYFFTWLYFLISVQEYVFHSAYQSNMKDYVQIIGEIAIGLQLPITILYWGVVHLPNTEGLDMFIQVVLHIVPIVFLTIDMVLNPFLYQLSHYLFVFLAALVYLAANIAYTLLSKPIYSMLIWTDFMSYVYMVGTFLLIFIMLALCRAVAYYWKERVFQRRSENVQEERIGSREDMPVSK